MFEVSLTAKAQDQLRAIIFYLADYHDNVDYALQISNKIKQAIESLSLYPKLGSVCHSIALRKQGFRVLVVDRYLIFYKIFETTNQVIIYAMVDGRREYLNLI